jgi:hypothetical protein
MYKNNDDRHSHPRTLVITAMVLVVAAIRLAPHPMNFAPIGALALLEALIFPASARPENVPFVAYYW